MKFSYCFLKKSCAILQIWPKILVFIYAKKKKNRSWPWASPKFKRPSSKKPI